MSFTTYKLCLLYSFESKSSKYKTDHMEQARISKMSTFMYLWLMGYDDTLGLFTDAMDERTKVYIDICQELAINIIFIA